MSSGLVRGSHGEPDASFVPRSSKDPPGMASPEGEDPRGCFSHILLVTGDSAPEEALAASPCTVSACQGPSGSTWPRWDPCTSQGLSLPVPRSSTGHDSDSDSELSLDEQSSSYASSHSSDSEDDGVGAEEKWDPTRGAIHSTPKGERVGHTGPGWAVDSRLGAGLGHGWVPSSQDMPSSTAAT